MTFVLHNYKVLLLDIPIHVIGGSLLSVGGLELDLLRQKARDIIEGRLRTRGDVLIPFLLTSFIFEALCLPPVVSCTVPVFSSGNGNGSSMGNALTSLGLCYGLNGTTGASSASSASARVGAVLRDGSLRLPSDATLGLEAALVMLGARLQVSEAAFPLLCEGTRRQRGDLALSMMLFYRDEHLVLSQILDRLLDRQLSPHFRAPSLIALLSSSHDAPPHSSSLSSSSSDSATHFHSQSADRISNSAHVYHPPSDSYFTASGDFSQYSAASLDRYTELLILYSVHSRSNVEICTASYFLFTVQYRVFAH